MSRTDSSISFQFWFFFPARRLFAPFGVTFVLALPMIGARQYVGAYSWSGNSRDFIHEIGGSSPAKMGHGLSEKDTAQILA
jgi:hypothetical protein